MKPGSQGLYKNGIKNVRNYFQIPSLLNSVNYTKGLAGYYDLDQGAKIFLDMIYVPKGILQI